MPTYPNLPGSKQSILEGGLRSTLPLTSKPTLVIATATQGPAGRAV